MQYVALIKLLILLMFANGSPLIAKRILGSHFSSPLDGNITFFDGRPLFGPCKTIRGVLASVVATALCAPFLGLDFKIGLLVGTTAMAGDLFSSFLKRRLGLPPSSRATGLDQIPESVFPLFVCRQAFSLTALDILIGAAIFFVCELTLSRLLFRVHIRDRPY